MLGIGTRRKIFVIGFRNKYVYVDWYNDNWYIRPGDQLRSRLSTEPNLRVQQIIKCVRLTKHQ